MAIGVIMIGLILIAGYNFFKSFSDYSPIVKLS